MQITHDELVLILEQEFPALKSNRDYFVAMYIDPVTNAQQSTAFITEWSANVPQPTVEQIEAWIIQYDVLLKTTRALHERVMTHMPVSARQLWLMARELGIRKADVLATLEPTEEDSDETKYKKETLYIELTEPPLAGFLRDSPTTEDFRELMGIPFEQFDDLWLMASKL